MKIRKPKKSDAINIAILIKETFKKYNSSDFFEKDIIRRTLAMFDLKKKSEEELWDYFNVNPIQFIAENNGEIIGVVNGNPERITGLFVQGKEHQKGIGTLLCKKFEKTASDLGSNEIKVRSSLYAVPFYQKMGYKKTTGVRSLKGLKVIHMRKALN